MNNACLAHVPLGLVVLGIYNDSARVQKPKGTKAYGLYQL